MADEYAGPFDRCGLSSLDDLATAEWRALFVELEQQQARFLAHEAQFRSPDYLRLWPRDPLYNWSRMWEYPYALYHLRRFRQAQTGNTALTVADIGSGVTFFPFAVAEAGYRVLAVDSDPTGARDYPAACTALGVSDEAVSFRQADARALPFADGALDAAYCISVLEHIPGPETVVREIARVLRAGGLFVLTMDIDLRGNAEIGPAGFAAVSRELARWFVPVAPERTIHPVRLNDSYTLPYPLFYRRSQLRKALNFAKRVVLAGLGRGWVNPKELWLACYGWAGRRI